MTMTLISNLIICVLENININIKYKHIVREHISKHQYNILFKLIIDKGILLHWWALKTLNQLLWLNVKHLSSYSYILFTIRIYGITPLTSRPDPRVFTRFISVGLHPSRPIRAAAWLVTARVTVRCDTRRHVSRVTLGAVLTLVTTRHPGIVCFMRWMTLIF